MSSAFQNISCAISLLFSGSDFAEDYIFILPFCVLVAHLKMIIWCKENTLKWCGVVISWHFYEDAVVVALWAAKYSIWISNNLHVNFYSLAERVILLLVCVASVSGFLWLWLCKNCGQMKKLRLGWGEEQRKSRDLCASISLAPLSPPPPFPSSYLECDWPWCLNFFLLEILMSVRAALKCLNFGYELNYIIILVWRIHVKNCRCGSISLL